jgi:hypothetical protein
VARNAVELPGRPLDDLGDLFDRFLAIVDKFDDFAVLSRHLREAGAQLRGAVLGTTARESDDAQELRISKARLEEMIERATVDAYNASEQLAGWRRRASWSYRFLQWPIQQRSATGRFLALKKTSRGVR